MIKDIIQQSQDSLSRFSQLQYDKANKRRIHNSLVGEGKAASNIPPQYDYRVIPGQMGDQLYRVATPEGFGVMSANSVDFKG